MYKGRTIRTQYNSLQSFWPGLQAQVGRSEDERQDRLQDPTYEVLRWNPTWEVLECDPSCAVLLTLLAIVRAFRLAVGCLVAWSTPDS
jgi:hypothetical protein